MDDTLALGYERWGTKEVRANALEHMELLSEIFPKSKYIFLIRNPYDIYQSIKGKIFHNNFDNPYIPIQIWNDNVYHIFNNKKDIKNKCLIVKYEDLINNTKINYKSLADIASHLNISINDDMFEEINTVIDSSKNISNKLTNHEVYAINNIIKETINISGYKIMH